MEDTLIRIHQDEYLSIINDYNKVARSYNNLLEGHLQDSYNNMEVINNNTVIGIENEAIVVHNQFVIIDLLCYLSYMLGVIVLLIVLYNFGIVKIEESVGKIKKMLTDDDEDEIDNSYRELKNVKVIAV